MGPDDIKKLRIGLGWSQERLARELGVSFSTVNRWERGRSQPSGLALVGLHRLKPDRNANKRCAPRFDVRCPVEFTRAADMLGGLSVTDNVSCGGVMFTTDADLRAGDILELLLRGNGHKSTVAAADIVWTSGNGGQKKVGARFSRVSHQELAGVIEYGLH